MSAETASDQPHLPPAYRLVALESCGSTNEEAKLLAADGAEDGTLVWAKQQTGGKGRRGRHWESPVGNLYLSLILRPECPVARAAQLGFAAALAVGDAIGSVAPPMIEVTYKWPNDVLFNDRKGAGILLESALSPDGTLDWLVLGVGINIQSYPRETTFPATSLHFEGAPPALNPVVTLNAFARHFLTWVNTWLEDGFAPLRKTWLRHVQSLGENIVVRLPKETLEGRFETIDDDGALLLALPDGARRIITAGEVFALGH